MDRGKLKGLAAPLLILCILTVATSSSAVTETPTSDQTEENGVTFSIIEEAVESRDITFDLISEPSAANKSEAAVNTAEAADTTDTQANQNAPYNFTYIYFIGGDCNDPDDWYSRYTHAAMETLNITRNICSQGEQYTLQFDHDALREIEKEVGPKLNETLVISAGYGMAKENDWTPVVDLLRKGMGFFHGGYTQELKMVNLTQFNLDEKDVFYMYFNLNEEPSALKAGREVCRLSRGKTPLNIAKIYSHSRTDLDFRIEKAIEGFQEECNETELALQWETREQNETSLNQKKYKNKLRFHNLPDVVFTAQDEVAADILDVAHEILLPEDASQIATTGWDYKPEKHIHYKKILTTVDQMVFYPNRGLWHKVKTIIEIAQENGIRSTKALREELELGNESYITSDTLTISSDQMGYLINALTAGYDPRVAPSDDVLVHAGLHDVSITKMAPFDGQFETVVWLRWSWVDPRLSWNPQIYNGTLSIEPTEIWFPQLFFGNLFDSEELYTSLAIVTSNGTVTLEQNLKAIFLCATTQGIKRFPFDSYRCNVALRAPEDITLNQVVFEVIEKDPHFDTIWTLNDDSDSDDEDEVENTADTVYFLLFFDRESFTAWVRMILPAVLINMVGFMAFWITKVSDAIALGITSLLCTLTFRETIEMPDTADVTWSEVFMMINVCYQAAVMAILWLSYSKSSRTVATGVNTVAKYVHPKKVCDDVKKTPNYIQQSISSIDVRQAPNALAKSCKTVGSTLTFSFPSGGGSVGGSVNGSKTTGMPAIPEGEEESNSNFESNDLDEPEVEHEELFLQGIPEETDSDSSPSTLRQRKVGFSDTTMLDVSEITPPAFDEDRRESFLRMSARYAGSEGSDSSSSNMHYYGTDQQNMTWIGRWIIVPSYVIIMILLLTTNWF